MLQDPAGDIDSLDDLVLGRVDDGHNLVVAVDDVDLFVGGVVLDFVGPVLSTGIHIGDDLVALLRGRVYVDDRDVTIGQRGEQLVHVLSDHQAVGRAAGGDRAHVLGRLARYVEDVDAIQ